MRKLMVVLGLSAPMVAGLAVPASAAPHPTGPVCGFATRESTAFNDVHDAVYFGGPLVLGDDANPAVVYSGSVTCTIQAGIFNDQHSDPDTCSTTGPVTGVTASLPPQTCAFFVDDDDEVYICTRVNLVGGTTLYYAQDDLTPGFWTTNANAPCARSARFTADDFIVSDIKRSVIDPIICPILQPFFPPDGDVGIFWDCPPYSTNSPTFAYSMFFWAPEVAT